MNRVDNLIKNKYIADIEEKLIVKPDLIGINNRLNVNHFYDPLIEQKSIQTAIYTNSAVLPEFTFGLYYKNHFVSKNRL